VALLPERGWPAVKTPVQQSCIELVKDESQQSAEIPENRDYMSLG